MYASLEERTVKIARAIVLKESSILLRARRNRREGGRAVVADLVRKIAGSVCFGCYSSERGGFTVSSSAQLVLPVDLLQRNFITSLDPPEPQPSFLPPTTTLFCSASAFRCTPNDAHRPPQPPRASLPQRAVLDPGLRAPPFRFACSRSRASAALSSRRS
jgi:hypothetical protein